MAAKRWAMVRVQEKTHEALRELSALWFSQWLKGSTVGIPEPSDRHGISLDQVIAELIRRDADHRKRSAKKTPRGPRKDTKGEAGETSGQ